MDECLSVWWSVQFILWFHQLLIRDYGLNWNEVFHFLSDGNFEKGLCSCTKWRSKTAQSSQSVFVKCCIVSLWVKMLSIVRNLLFEYGIHFRIIRTIDINILADNVNSFHRGNEWGSRYLFVSMQLSLHSTIPSGYVLESRYFVSIPTEQGID